MSPAQGSNQDDNIKALSGKAAISLAVFVVVAQVAFQAFGKHLEIDQLTAKVAGGAFLYIIYFYWRRGKQVEQSTPVSEFKPLILHIEDNPVQQSVFRYGLKKLQMDFDLQQVETGEQALALLTRQDFLVLKPDIIVLDLALGDGMSGQEFLEKIKTDRDLSFIPVIILSSTTRNDAARPEILDTCRFYVERNAGMDGLREAIMSCDPRQKKTAFEELSEKCEQYRKMNHTLRGTLGALITAIEENMSPDELKEAAKDSRMILRSASNLSDRWRLPPPDDLPGATAVRPKK